MIFYLSAFWARFEALLQKLRLSAANFQFNGQTKTPLTLGVLPLLSCEVNASKNNKDFLFLNLTASFSALDHYPPANALLDALFSGGWGARIRT